MTTNVIRHRYTNAIIYTATDLPEGAPIVDALKQAIAARAYLARANLADANLADADLAGANLAGAYLARADLADADLAGANLAGAYLARADLADANLADANLAGAYLAGANLAGAYLARADLADANLADANLADANLAGAYLARADLADANLAGADLAGADLAGADLAGAYLARAVGLSASTPRTDPPEPYVRRVDPARFAERAARFRAANPAVPVVDQLDAKILDAVTATGGKLEMGDWHTCETTHCRAGWAIHLAGPAGYDLEKRVGSRQAGAAIYRASTGRVPHFFATNERALEDIRRCAEEANRV